MSKADITAGGTVNLSWLYKEHPEHAEAISKGFAELDQNGLVQFVENDHSCTLTEAGGRLADDLRRLRGNLSLRRWAARGAVLRSIHLTLSTNAEYSAYDFILSSFNRYYGQLFAYRDYKNATEWLARRGYITIEGVSGKVAAITPAGRDLFSPAANHPPGPDVDNTLLIEPELASPDNLVATISQSRGYDLQPDLRAQLRLLNWIADKHTILRSANIPLGELFQGRVDRVADTVAGNLEHLEELGLVILTSSSQSDVYADWLCTALPSGLHVIEDLRRRRGELVRRRQAVRDASLQWLHATSVSSSTWHHNPDFATSMFDSYYGQPFTYQEIHHAEVWLEQEGFVMTDTTKGGDPSRLHITPKGDRCVEGGRSVNDDVHGTGQAPVSYFHVCGSPGTTIASHGPGAAQTVSLTLTEDSRRQVAAVADNLEGLLNLGALGLDDQQTAQAEHAVIELRQAIAQPAADKSAVRRALEKAREVAVSGTGAVLGEGVVALAQQALQGLGLG